MENEMGITFAEYLRYAASMKKTYPEWRMGQTYFNVLASANGHLAVKVRTNPDLDPFHDDDKIGEFLVYVNNNWS